FSRFCILILRCKFEYFDTLQDNRSYSKEYAATTIYLTDLVLRGTCSGCQAPAPTSGIALPSTCSSSATTASSWRRITLTRNARRASPTAASPARQDLARRTI